MELKLYARHSKACTILNHKGASTCVLCVFLFHGKPTKWSAPVYKMCIANSKKGRNTRKTNNNNNKMLTELPAATVIVWMRLLFTCAACFTLTTCMLLNCWAGPYEFQSQFVSVQPFIYPFFIAFGVCSVFVFDIFFSFPIHILRSWISISDVFNSFSIYLAAQICLLVHWVVQWNNRLCSFFYLCFDVWNKIAHTIFKPKV